MGFWRPGQEVNLALLFLIFSRKFQIGRPKTNFNYHSKWKSKQANKQTPQQTNKHTNKQKQRQKQISKQTHTQKKKKKVFTMTWQEKKPGDIIL